MFKSKSNRLAVYNFKQSLVRLGWALVWYLGIVAVFPLVFNLVFGNNGFGTMIGYVVSTTLNSFVVVSGVYLVADAMTMNYENFKWSIQNGISRRTAWLGRLKALLALTLVTFVLNLIINAIFSSHFSEMVKFTMGDGSSFSNHDGVLTSVIFEFLFFLLLMAGSLAAGYILALLNRRGKLILIIGFPILLVVFLSYLAKFVIMMNPDWDRVVYGIKMMVGYSAKTGPNLWIIAAYLIVLIIIFLAISYYVSQKLRLRRE